MLDNFQIQKLLPGVKIMLYEQLQGVNNIDQIIPPQGCIMLMPGKSRTNGHWVCLFHDPLGNIVFFDSYGGLPDEAEEFDINNSLPHHLYRRLSYLLYKSKRNIFYNQFQLQSWDDKISSCGMWCIARLKLKNLTDEEFYNMWRDKPNEPLSDKLIEHFVLNY
jgi:hypothetical protein